MKSFRTAITVLLLCLACCDTLQAQEWLTNGLVAYLPMDGDAIDASGNGINGTLLATTPIANRLGQPSAALMFTNGSFVDMGVPVSLQFGGDFTITAWVNFLDGDTDTRILSNGGDSGYELIATGSSTNRQFQFNVAGSNVVSEANYLPDEWHFVAAQLEGADARLYVDGNCVGTNALSAVPAYAGNLYFGRSEAGNYYGGTIDEFRSYNRALSANELAELFALGPVSGPVITVQPVSGTNYVLTNTSFSVTAAGIAPLSYQWRKNGSELAGQTNAVLVLNSLMTNDTAGYSVVVTNNYGSVASGVAMLTVKRLPQYITYCQTLPTNLVVGDPPFQFIATFNSGLPAFFHLGSSAVASNAGNTIYINGIGLTSFLVVAHGNSIYADSALYGQGALTVGGIPLAITAQPTNHLVNVGDAAAIYFRAVGTGSIAYLLQKQSTILTTNLATNAVVSGLTNIITTSSYPSPPPTTGVQTNVSYITVAAIPDPIPYGTVSNLITTLATNTTYPTIGTYVGTVRFRPPRSYIYNLITGTNYTYPTFTFTYPVVTNPITNYFVHTNLGTAPHFPILQRGLTLSNELNTAFVLTNVQTSDAGNYFVVITNHSRAVTSSIVTLTVNHHPIAAPDTFTCKGSAPLNIPIAGLLQNDSDLDGNALSLLDVSPLSLHQATLSQNGSFITYTPLALSNLTDQFTYTISDGRTGTATGMVTIRLMPALTLSGTMLPDGFAVTAADALGGRTYLLQAGTNSDATISWQTIGTNAPVDDGPIQFLDPDATNLMTRLYRVLIP